VGGVDLKDTSFTVLGILVRSMTPNEAVKMIDKLLLQSGPLAVVSRVITIIPYSNNFPAISCRVGSGKVALRWAPTTSKWSFGAPKKRLKIRG